MEYDIIEKVAQVASSGPDSGAVLDRAAGVILDASRFDQCAVYVWDEEKRKFFLKGSAGAGAMAGSYGEYEGIPGRVKETMAPVACTGTLPGGSPSTSPPSPAATSKHRSAGSCSRMSAAAPS